MPCSDCGKGPPMLRPHVRIRTCLRRLHPVTKCSPIWVTSGSREGGETRASCSGRWKAPTASASMARASRRRPICPPPRWAGWRTKRTTKLAGLEASRNQGEQTPWRPCSKFWKQRLRKRTFIVSEGTSGPRSNSAQEVIGQVARACGSVVHFVLGSSRAGHRSNSQVRHCLASTGP